MKPSSKSRRSSSTPAFRVKRDIVSRAVQGDVVVLDLASGTYFSLNPTGAFVWERVKKGTPVTEIPAALAEEFDVTAERASRDVERLVKELSERGLIEPA